MGAVDLQVTGARVEALFVSLDSGLSEQRTELVVDSAGVEGDSHYATLRSASYNDPKGVKDMPLYNNRAVCIVAAAHARQIAEDMDLPIDQIEDRREQAIELTMAMCLSANVLLRCIDTCPFESFIGPSTKLHVADGHRISTAIRKGVTTQYVDLGLGWTSALALNEFTAPCKKPAGKMHEMLEDLGLPIPNYEEGVSMSDMFKSVSAANRGWVAGVLGPTVISVGQQVYAEQPLNPHAVVHA